MLLRMIDRRRPRQDDDSRSYEEDEVDFFKDGMYHIPPPGDRDRRLRQRRLRLRRRVLPPPSQEYHIAKPASAQKLRAPPIKITKEFLKSISLHPSSIVATSSSCPQAAACDTIVASPPLGQCLPGSTLLVREPSGWGVIFYIRVDLRGLFYTYPHLGGPFQSLQEANEVIDRHLHDRRDPKLCKEQDGVSLVEMSIRLTLYWLDGTRKKCSKLEAIEKGNYRMRLLVQALVDKYNDDHNLLEDLAYELKDVLHYQFISERHSTVSKKNRFYHLNFTAKTKGAGDFDSGMDNLFFAELMAMSGEYEEMVVSSFCMVKPSDNGHCYGCTNSGSVDMKHPDNVDAYAGGHLNVYLPHRRVGEYWNDSSDDPVAEEARLRRMYKVLGSL